VLQEWLEEIVEKETEKTASAQLEAVLQDMDIPELKAFCKASEEIEKQAAPQQWVEDPRVEQAAIRAGTIGGGAAGALGGGVMGAALGNLAGKSKHLSRSLGPGKGALLGAGLGALGLGGLGALEARAYAKKHYGGQGVDLETGKPREFNQTIMNEELSPAAQLGARSKAREIQREQLLQAAQEKQAASKFKSAVDIGKTLAEVGFNPFKQKAAGFEGMSDTDKAKVQAVRNAMKATKGGSVSDVKQTMKAVGKQIPNKPKTASRTLIAKLKEKGVLPAYQAWQI
jgi:hypothetical protein